MKKEELFRRIERKGYIIEKVNKDKEIKIKYMKTPSYRYKTNYIGSKEIWQGHKGLKALEEWFNRLDIKESEENFKSVQKWKIQWVVIK